MNSHPGWQARVCPRLAQPKSRGWLRLSGPDVSDPVLIEPNSLSEPEDMAAALAAVELCRDLENSNSSTPLVSHETAPGLSDKSGMIEFIRRSAVTYWHQCGTAKMGRDSMSVVDSELKVCARRPPSLNPNRSIRFEIALAEGHVWRRSARIL
jgi:choline dehydrogenase-like flavoprotein